MKNQFQEKVVGCRRRQMPGSPGEYHRRALIVQAGVERLNPFRRPRGFVFKAKSWSEYEAWKQKQNNPRLW
jgi:hypothetical protein